MAEPLTVVSLVIGAWGAGVATILAANQVRHDRRTLKVLCMVRYLGPPRVELILVRAVNEGLRPVEVIQVAFEADNGDVVWGLPARGQGLPQLLGDGQSLSINFDRDALESNAVESRSRIKQVVVTDASGIEYRASYPQQL